MTYLWSILAGLLGAAAGWIAGAQVRPPAGLSLPALPAALGFAANYLAYLTPALVGAAIATLVAVAVVLRLRRGYRSFGAFAAHVLMVSAVVAAIAVAAAAYRDVAFDRLDMNAGARTVEFEIRMPTALVLPKDRADIQVELHTDKNQTLATVSAVTSDGSRPVLRGSVPISFRTTRRELVFALPGEPVRVFRLFLPANPNAQPELGAWQLAEPDPQSVGVSPDFAIRYRAY